MSVVLNVCNLLHGLASLRLSRMFHRVLDVCENQTMPMTLAQDRHLLNGRSMQVMFWYSRQKGQTNWQLYIWFHIGWNKNRSRCKVQPPFYHIFPPTSTSPPSPGGPARLLIFVDFSGIIPGEGGKVSSVKFAPTFRPVSGSFSKNFPPNLLLQAPQNPTLAIAVSMAS